MSHPRLITSAEHWLGDAKNEQAWLDRPAAVIRRAQVQAVTAALIIARRKVRGCIGPCGDAEQLLESIKPRSLVPPLHKEETDAE